MLHLALSALAVAVSQEPPSTHPLISGGNAPAIIFTRWSSINDLIDRTSFYLELDRTKSVGIDPIYNTQTYRSFVVAERTFPDGTSEKLSSESCRDIEIVGAQLSNLQPIQLSPSGLTWRDSAPPTQHGGMWVEVTTRGYDDDHRPVLMTVTANEGQIRDWVLRASDVLNTCSRTVQ